MFTDNQRYILKCFKAINLNCFKMHPIAKTELHVVTL